MDGAQASIIHNTFPNKQKFKIKPKSCVHQLSCIFCQKQAIDLQHYQIHTRETPFICNICNKEFATVEHLKNHRLKHAEKSEHKCATCNKSFLTKTYLKD